MQRWWPLVSACVKEVTRLVGLRSVQRVNERGKRRWAPLPRWLFGLRRNPGTFQQRDMPVGLPLPDSKLERSKTSQSVRCPWGLSRCVKTSRACASSGWNTRTTEAAAAARREKAASSSAAKTSVAPCNPDARGLPRLRPSGGSFACLVSRSKREKYHIRRGHAHVVRPQQDDSPPHRSSPIGSPTRCDTYGSGRQPSPISISFSPSWFG
jgi:hypothetical protein